MHKHLCWKNFCITYLDLWQKRDCDQRLRWANRERSCSRGLLGERSWDCEWARTCCCPPTRSTRIPWLPRLRSAVSTGTRTNSSRISDIARIWAFDIQFDSRILVSWSVAEIGLWKKRRKNNMSGFSGIIFLGGLRLVYYTEPVLVWLVSEIEIGNRKQPNSYWCLEHWFYIALRVCFFQ